MNIIPSIEVVKVNWNFVINLEDMTVTNTVEFSVNMTCGKCKKKVADSLDKYGSLLIVNLN